MIYNMYINNQKTSIRIDIIHRERENFQTYYRSYKNKKIKLLCKRAMDMNLVKDPLHSLLMQFCHWHTVTVISNYSIFGGWFGQTMQT